VATLAACWASSPDFSLVGDALVDAWFLATQHRVVAKELRLIHHRGLQERLDVNLTRLAIGVDRILPGTLLDVPGSMPRACIRAAVLGTDKGSLTPQSAELSTMMRSEPYFWTISAMRSEPILVPG